MTVPEAVERAVSRHCGQAADSGVVRRESGNLIIDAVVANGVRIAVPFFCLTVGVRLL